MKKTYITFSAMALALLSTGVMASCGEAETAKAPAKASTAKNAAQALPNYRYVDLDSVLSKYNLAKDYSEEMLRKLILSGMNCARFNFSHGTHESQLATLTRLKRVREGGLKLDPGLRPGQWRPLTQQERQRLYQTLSLQE